MLDVGDGSIWWARDTVIMVGGGGEGWPVAGSEAFWLRWQLRQNPGTMFDTVYAGESHPDFLFSPKHSQMTSHSSLVQAKYRVCIVNWKFDINFISCDQAALWMVQSVRPSVRPSVRLSHLFDYVPIIVSSWNFQELLPVTKVTSMQKVNVRDQRSRSQRSQPNFTISGL